MAPVVSALAWIEFKVYLRNRTALFWTFVNPLVTMIVLMLVFGGQQRSLQLPVDLFVPARLQQGEARLVDTVFADLQARNYLQVHRYTDAPERRAALGARLTVTGSGGAAQHLRLEQLYGEPSHFRLLETAVQASLNGRSAASLPTDRIIGLTAVARGGSDDARSYGEYLAVGMLILTVISVCLYGFSVPLVEMRSSGAGRMYQIFPMGVGEFMAAYILSRLGAIVLLGVIIILFADKVYGLGFPTGNPLFLLDLIAICILAAVAFISIGVMIAGLSSSVAAANAFVNIAYLPLMLFSDIFLPLSLFPEGMAAWLQLQPVAQFVNGARMVLIDGEPLLFQWKALLSLLALALVSLGVARLTFRWRQG